MRKYHTYEEEEKARVEKTRAIVEDAVLNELLPGEHLIYEKYTRRIVEDWSPLRIEYPKNMVVEWTPTGETMDGEPVMRGTIKIPVSEYWNPYEPENIVEYERSEPLTGRVLTKQGYKKLLKLYSRTTAKIARKLMAIDSPSLPLVSKYLSGECMRKWHVKVRQAEERPMLVKTCPNCGRVFNSYKKNRVYCCSSCYYESYQKKYVEKLRCNGIIK